MKKILELTEVQTDLLRDAIATYLVNYEHAVEPEDLRELYELEDTLNGI